MVFSPPKNHLFFLAKVGPGEVNFHLVSLIGVKVYDLITEEKGVEITMDSNREEIEERDTNAPDNFLNAQDDDSVELKIGMIANSEEEAYNMYNEYAYHKGFSIRKDEKTYKRGTTELIRRSFVCSREGFTEFSDSSQEKKYDRLDTRCGCRARVVFKVENGVYEISQLIIEHNHPLIESSQRHLIRSARKIHNTSKGVIKSMADASIRVSKTYAYLLNEAGGYQNIGFTERDCHNFAQVERSKKIAAGDGQSVMNYFKHKQTENSMFFYTMQVDEENRMTNFFWRDGISKLDYECFGDVVIFDTTYRTNKYNMICAPFVGVNHHWKNVLFGCAFLGDETTTSFIWLFDAMQSFVIGPSRFCVPTPNVPIVQQMPEYLNMPFTSMLQSSFSMSHLSQGSLNSVTRSQSSPSIHNFSEDAKEDCGFST